MDPSIDDLRQTTEGVWSAVLGIPIEGSPVEGGDLPAVVSCVYITGAWEGSVVVFSERSLARTLAGAMFAMGADEVGETEVSDAIAEIANIIGGNIKAMLPQPSLLSLPSTFEGPWSSRPFAMPNPVCTFEFLCEGAPVSVVVSRAREFTLHETAAK